ncbi:MAG: hypothetical protein WDM80_16060 [Limisphaerales bacterium]
MPFIKKHRSLLAIVFIIAAIISLVIWASTIHPEIYKEIGKAILLIGFAGIAILGIFGASKIDDWSTIFSVVLFICGLGLIGFGMLIEIGLLLTKEGTVFQEYEAIFLGLGGIIIVSLSLILSALIAIKRNQVRQLMSFDNPKN